MFDKPTHLIRLARAISENDAQLKTAKILNLNVIYTKI